LHLFPFHALPWSSGFLIETFAVSYIPNLSVLLAPSRQPVLARRLIAGVGTFPANFGLSSLPGVEQELKGIAEAYRAAGAQSEATVVLEGTSAVRKQFAEWNRSGVLESFSCIHLATHGSSVLSVDTMDTPMESHLFLSDSAWDGLEISSLRLNPDLVVLSACNSGQRAVAGRGFGELPGDEIFGIQLAFAMAGAKAVIGCLWPTNDEVARAMMIDLHTRVARGCSPETALQSAIVSALRQFDRRHAYLWAPFFLTILGSQPESS
jgi:CHAT domain-containing protein